MNFKEKYQEERKKSTGVIIVALVISLILSMAVIYLLWQRHPCATFPAQQSQWCAAEGTYYIAALDEIFMDEEGFVDTYKEIALITIEETYNFDDPPVEVYGSVLFWAGIDWTEGYWLNFPFDYYGEGYAPLIPCTYNNYAVTEDLIFESLSNIVAESEGNYEVINFSITHAECYVTMTQECHDSLPFYDPDSEYLVDGYYYGVEYELEAWLDFNSTALIYVLVQVVSECHSGIPLFQSMIFATWIDGYGWIATSIFSLKTIATSIPLLEV